MEKQFHRSNVTRFSLCFLQFLVLNCCSETVSGCCSTVNNFASKGVQEGCRICYAERLSHGKSHSERDSDVLRPHEAAQFHSGGKEAEDSELRDRISGTQS